ncbi:hypothetical protein, partial [Escherichia coli]|uniref:hypothetical protein n=1 Tax=Escherichia coli TaxID=562 RepID=UPI0020C05182
TALQQPAQAWQQVCGLAARPVARPVQYAECVKVEQACQQQAHEYALPAAGSRTLAGQVAAEGAGQAATQQPTQGDAQRGIAETSG